MPKSQQQARTRDGTRLAYTLYDHPTPSRHIALIHSLAMDRSFWRPVAERLATDACVLIHDCRDTADRTSPRVPSQSSSMPTISPI